MNKMRWIGMISVMAAMASVSQAATRTWDGDAGDGLWTNAMNWDGNTSTPGNGDTANISNGDTVTSVVQNMPGNFTLNLSGNSTLTRLDSVIRLNGATLHVASGSGLTGTGFWDLDDADITFDDGAVATMSNWEQKDYNTFTFNLSASGFSALTPSSFLIGKGSLIGNISNATYNVDMDNYTGGPGIITLADFGNDYASMDNAKFQGAGGLNILNNESYPNTTITWNDSTEAIQLNVVDAVWDGGAGDGLWTNAVNWAGDVVPATGNIVHISNGDTVEWDQSISIPANLTIELTGNSTLHSSWVLRCNGATINVASGCSLTSDVNDYFDLANATVSFEDGAINTVSRWEHKGNNTFDFKLSATGFTTLTPGWLMFGNSGTWALSTYNIDISDYNRLLGTTITLMDFSTASNGGTFDPSAKSPTVNVTGHDGGTLVWDAVNKALILKIKAFPGTVILIY
jgi:hypothetical protein